jgi:hypothetical protein
MAGIDFNDIRDRCDVFLESKRTEEDHYQLSIENEES